MERRARREDDDRPRTPDDERREEAAAPAYLREFLRLCREAGRPKPAGATLREAITHLEEGGIEGPQLFDPLAEYHYGVLYRDESRNRSREGELRRGLKGLRRGLK